MDFAFNEEQLMLKDQARSFLADKWPSERLAGVESAAFDRTLWRSIVDLGWVGLSAPEDAGGAGMSFLEEAILFEELGYALYAGPYFSTVALALPALSGDLEALTATIAGGAPATLAWAEAGGSPALTAGGPLSTKAENLGGGWRLSGEKDLVPDGHVAEAIVVSAQSSEGPGLWLTERSADGVDARTLETADATRRSSRITFREAPATLIAGPGDAEPVLQAVRLRARAAAALEAVGIAQRALDLGVRHVSERKQFGRAIGEYQAVSHQMSDTYVETELARSLAYWAAWCVAEGDAQAEVAVAGAKAAASDAAVAACERSIQVHGGIGFTWEHVLHRYLKRADWIAAFEGSAADNRRIIADELLG